MNLNDITIFLTVVRCQNFSKAASLLYSSQTTVSQRISALEKELGYPLLSRKQGFRTIELTPQGTQFLPIAEHWLALWDTSLAIKASQYKPLLSIGATNRLNTHFLAPFFNHLSRTTVSFIPDIRSDHSKDLIELVARKELDIGFISNPVHVKEVTFHPFLKENIVMICRQGQYYPDEFIHPSNLDIRHEVHLASNPEIDSWHDIWWNRYQQSHMYVDTAMMAVYYLSEPHFWTLCPYSVAKSLKEIFPIEIHPFAVESPIQTSYLIYHQSPKPNKSTLIRVFEREFKQFYIAQNLPGFLL